MPDLADQLFPDEPAGGVATAPPPVDLATQLFPDTPSASAPKDLADTLFPDEPVRAPKTAAAVAGTAKLIPEAVAKPLRAVGSYVMGMIPTSIEQVERAANIPTNWKDPLQVAEFIAPPLKPTIDLAQQAVARTQQIKAAEQTPAFSQERWNAGIGTALDLAGLAAIAEGIKSKGGEVIAKEPNIQTGEVPLKQGEPVVSGPEGAAQAGDTRETPAQEPAQAVSPHDLVPALHTEGYTILGVKGMTHDDVINIQPDPTALRASDPLHGFWNTKTNEFYTRDEAAQKLGISEELHSERLRELQQEGGVREETKSAGEPNQEQAAPDSDKIQAQRQGQEAVGEPPVPPAGAGVPPHPEVAANAAAFDKIYGTGEIPVGATLSPEEEFSAAQARAAAGKANPYGFVDRARTGAITPHEMADLVYEHDRLVNEAAAAEGTPQYEELYQRARTFAEKVVKPAETAWHQKGMAMQIKAPIDYSRLTGFRRGLEKQMGREMTPQEAPAFQKVANDVARTKVEAQRAASETANRVQKHFSKVRDIPFEDAAKQMHDMIAELVKECEL